MPKISVRFYLSKPSEPFTNIMSSVNYNKVRVRVSTGITIASKYWSKKTQRVKSSSPHAIHQNQLLEKFAHKVIDSVYSLINNEGNVTKHDLLEITAEHSNSDNNSVNKNGLTLVSAINECISQKRKEGVKESSLYNYSKFINVLREYETTKKKTLLVKNISYKMLSKFVTDYLIGERGISNQSAKFYLSIIKSTITYLRTYKEMQISDSYKKLKIKTLEDKPNRLTITVSEFHKIYNYTPADEENILWYKFKSLVRDRFLISVLTGLRFSDICQIDGTNQIEVDEDGNKWISIRDRKTSSKNYILLDSAVDMILERNNYSLKGKYKNNLALHNKYMKEVFKEAGIDRPFKTIKQSRGKITEVLKPAYKFASSHTGRRCTVTFLEKWDVTKSKIMQITNHRDRSITGVYNQHDQQKVRLEISELFAEKLGFDTPKNQQDYMC